MAGAPGASASGRAALRQRLADLWERRPFAVVMGLALALRLLAALFSRGFAFHDDHFEVIRPAQAWIDGTPGWQEMLSPGRSLFYPGLHWAILSALQGLGVTDPQAKMLVVRLLHAAWSLVTVAYGYRIAEAAAGTARARLAGLLLAALWLAPFTSVHQLVEVACQPPLVLAIWLLVRTPGGPRPRDAFVAGLCIGVAFAIRYQTIALSGTLGLVLLVQRRHRPALLLGAGALASAALIQGGSDWLAYGRPFSSVVAYFAFNSDPKALALYPSGPWWQYLATLFGVLVPPASLLLLWGVLRGARRLPLLFWPAFAFVVVHSYYPGKQERFLLPAMPLLLVLAAIGAQALAEESPFLRRRPGLIRGLWAWFWAVNAALLALYTLNYSKRSRVEPLSFLHRQADVRGLVLETVEAGPPFVPTFYLGRPVPVFLLPAGKEVETLAAELGAASVRPNYALLTGEQRLGERLARLAPLFPRLVPVETFRPGPVDWLLLRMNPRHNVNLTARLYRVE